MEYKANQKTIELPGRLQPVTLLSVFNRASNKALSLFLYARGMTSAVKTFKHALQTRSEWFCTVFVVVLVSTHTDMHFGLFLEIMLYLFYVMRKSPLSKLFTQFYASTHCFILVVSGFCLGTAINLHLYHAQNALRQIYYNNKNILIMYLILVVYFFLFKQSWPQIKSNLEYMLCMFHLPHFCPKLIKYFTLNAYD